MIHICFVSAVKETITHTNGTTVTHIEMILMSEQKKCGRGVGGRAGGIFRSVWKI